MRRAFAVGHVVAVLAIVAVGAPAHADTVTLRGASIPLRGVEIHEIRSGRVYFRDARGGRQWRELDDVQAIGFDGLAALDRAEGALRGGGGDDAAVDDALDRALAEMLIALLAARDAEPSDELAELWIRARLARLHRTRGEYVQAASHLACVFMLRDESYWRRLEPPAPTEPASPAATHEAFRNLDEAAKRVRDPELRAVVRRLRDRIETLDQAARRSGDAVEPRGETLSGLTPEEIRRGTASADAGRPAPTAAPAPAPPTAGSARPRSDAGAGSEAAPSSPEAIDRLLEAGEGAAALARCEGVAARPGRRSLARFLYQYGRSLDLAGRPRDAAVMFMRCAILYPGTSQAAESLVESARIHLETWNRPATARRLLELALEQGGDRPAVAERARAMLASIPTETPDASSESSPE